MIPLFSALVQGCLGVTMERCREVSMRVEVTSRHLSPDLPKRDEVGRSPPFRGATSPLKGPGPGGEVR